ncbi:hypothetical protein EIH07_07905 [Chryseobacterium taklimakanense]|uniref:Uncharacterized protein n=1 Tax=Chryseobacterium taklimakanense TaxID=536441 RepID=A0A239WNJ1_9FLAO|nr:hypothetical protein [Chryseobacterium taklimakanense]AZI22965.1 hypothetical protein EIH07_07905 [Chryseobacterium taklimakanense]SNV36215.1 Uncharacterised protein [Chryseobacterium taklimakanense]
MKNLLLGLFLTVGTSGFTLANGIYESNELNIINNEKNADAISCTTGIRVTMKMCDGSKEVTNLGSFETDCGSNEDGSVIIRNIQLEEDCGPN